MKKHNYIFLLILLCCAGTFNELIAQVTYGPPEPPVGQRWILNEDFSDEFNGTSLDSDKWLDHHPKWSGREPGIFYLLKYQLKMVFFR